MQFHLNGFRIGDPRIKAPVASTKRSDDLPAAVDVFIVGSGPAGLTLAAQLAAFPDIRIAVIEQKPGPLTLGQADGIACRTMEMFEAFGFAERVLTEAYWVNETAFWQPDDRDRGAIMRGNRIDDTEEGLSEFPHVILNQARVHDFYLDAIRNASGGLEPLYGYRVTDLTVSEDPAESHPVTVRIEAVDGSAAMTVRARFVVGCDGARSEVRRALGYALKGDSANQAWGVMDVLAVTDFPDIRLKSVIHSGSEGSVLVIPREGGYLTRLYVELDELGRNERVASRNLTIERLIATAQRILRPYTLDVKEVAWWSVYEIGQRLCDQFDDVPEERRCSRVPRVFIAGDACHTHSPKAGQGMNVSMQDAFNLGWKLAAVLRGQSSPAILHTYSAERRAVAQELIDFDRAFAAMFSPTPKDPADADGAGIDPAEFADYFVRQGRFTAGTATRYSPSVISMAPSHQGQAAGLVVGMRFHSAPVVRLADARPVQLGHVLKADGRWRIIAFAPASDTGTGAGSAVGALCAFLAEDRGSPVVKYTPRAADIDSVIDVRAVFQQNHRDLDLQAMPPFLVPVKGRYRLHDYEKIFCPDFKRCSDIFALRAIDRTRGCVVIVRPDQHVAAVLPIDAHGAIADFFDGFMIAVPGCEPVR
jgi:phenol 2-monooxygenase